jgi:hypothetical protein
MIIRMIIRSRRSITIYTAVITRIRRQENITLPNQKISVPTRGLVGHRDSGEALYHGGYTWQRST